MADNEEGEETVPRGNECKVVSLTASAYATAAGPKQVDLSDGSQGKLGGDNEAVASNAIVNSHHFVYPPSQHENLPPKPESSEINDERGGDSDVSLLVEKEEGNSDVKDEENVSFKQLLPDEFPRIPMFDEKANMVSASGAIFDKGVVIEKERIITSSAKFLSSHHEETMDTINTVEENEGTDDIPFLRQIIEGTETSTTTSSGNNIQNINALCCFDGTNYLPWSQVVRASLMEIGKMGHLTDESPNQTDPEFKAWAEDDSMIVSWLRKSIKPEISRNLMFLTTAKVIWENLRQTYTTTKRKDCAVIYYLKIQVGLTKQGNMPVTDYYNRMAGLWLEIDNNRDLQLKSSHDVDVVRKLLQHDRAFEFLAGLNAEYDQIKVQILGKKLIPSLHEIFFIVRAEESRQQGASTMVCRRPAKGCNMGNAVFRAEESRQQRASAMVYRRPQNGNAIRQQAEPKKTCGKDELMCSHCHKPWHTTENCYEVHGKAQVRARIRGSYGRAQSQTNMAKKEENHVEATKSDKEELTESTKGNTESLRTLFNSLEKSSGQGNRSSYEVSTFNGEVTTPSVVTNPVSKVGMVQQVQEGTKHGDDDSRAVEEAKIVEVCDQVLGKRNLDLAEFEIGSKRCKSTSFKATSSAPTDELHSSQTKSQSSPAESPSAPTALQTTEDMLKEMKANQQLLMQAFEKVAPGLLMSLTQLTSSSTLPPPPP